MVIQIGTPSSNHLQDVLSESILFDSSLDIRPSGVQLVVIGPNPSEMIIEGVGFLRRDQSSFRQLRENDFTDLYELSEM